MKEPLVSLILTCYNHEPYVGDCIESVLDLSYANIELFICDDCSTDNSYRIIEGYEGKLREKFEKVYLIHHEINIGLVKTLNSLLTSCTGKYVKILSTDDMLLPNSINEMVEYLEIHSDIDLLYTNFYFIHETTHYPVNNFDNLKEEYQQTPPTGKGLTSLLCEKNFIGAPGVIAPRKTYIDVGLYDEEFYTEDVAFWLKASINGNFGYYNIYSCLYRVVSTSLSHFTPDTDGIKRFERYSDNIESIMIKYKDYCSKNAWENFYNAKLNQASELGDKPYADRMLQKIRKYKLNVRWRILVKYILCKIGLSKKVLFLYRKISNNK